jgi:hypothetical protein
MRTRRLTWLLVATLLAGCAGNGDADARPDSLVAQALAGVPLFPGAGISDVAGEGEAAHATLHINRSPDSVAAWYRRSLLARRWTIVSDVRTADSTVALHATDPGRRPIWLLIGRDASGAGTLVTVVGAVPAAAPDSAER